MLDKLIAMTEFPVNYIVTIEHTIFQVTVHLVNCGYLFTKLDCMYVYWKHIHKVKTTAAFALLVLIYDATYVHIMV